MCFCPGVWTVHFRWRLMRRNTDTDQRCSEQWSMEYGTLTMGQWGNFEKKVRKAMTISKVTSKRSQQLVRYEGLQADKQTHQKTWCNIQLLSEFERVLTERRTQLLLPWAPRFLCLRWISVKLRMTPLIGFVFSWTGRTTARSMTHRRGMTKLFSLLFQCDGE